MCSIQNMDDWVKPILGKDRKKQCDKYRILEEQGYNIKKEAEKIMATYVRWNCNN